MRSLRTKAMLAALTLVVGALAACGPGEHNGDDGGNPGPAPGATISLFAGSLKRAGSQDGTGEAAGFNLPEGVALDGAGNIYVADTGNHTIRKLAPDGSVITIAGTAGQAGSANGTGAAARFSSPRGIAADASGNVYVADTGNHTVRRITPGGVVTTLAGAAGVSGTADGGPADARFTSPTDIAVGPGGVLYVAGDSAVRRVGTDGTVNTFAGVAGQPGVVAGDGPQARFTDLSGVAVDASGNVYVSESKDGVGGTATGRLRRFSATAQSVPFGTDTTGFLSVPFAAGLAADATGGVVIASGGSVNLGSAPATRVFNAIYRVSSTGGIALIAGSDAQGSVTVTVGQAPVRRPVGVAVDSVGRVVFADAENHAIRRLDNQTNALSTLAGGAGVGKLDGGGTQARFFAPRGLMATADGGLLVADSGNASVRRVSPAGVVSTLQLQGDDGRAADFGSVLDVALAGQDRTYVLGLRGNLLQLWSCNAASRCAIMDTGGTQVWGISGDSAGNLYLAEASQVSVIGTNGVKRVLATGFAFALDVVAGSTGRVYVADSDNHVVRVLEANGQVAQTIGLPGAQGYADGAAAQARFTAPSRLALGSSGTLYVFDGNFTIRKVDTAGTVATIAGVAGQSGVEPGPALKPMGPVLGLAWAAGALYATIDNAVVKISPVN